MNNKTPQKEYIAPLLEITKVHESNILQNTSNPGGVMDGGQDEAKKRIERNELEQDTYGNLW